LVLECIPTNVGGRLVGLNLSTYLNRIETIRQHDIRLRVWSRLTFPSSINGPQPLTAACHPEVIMLRFNTSLYRFIGCGEP
jgi:hypothetical protein